MRHRCLIFGCKISPEERISYHRLTCKRYYAWMDALGRNPDENVANSNVLCSRHFSEKNYCIINGKRKLRKDAVPDKNLRVCKPQQANSALSSLRVDNIAVLENAELSPRQAALPSEMDENKEKCDTPTKIRKYFRLIHTYPSQICKTCSEEFTGDPHQVSSSLNNSRTTCKDMIIQLVPQMEDKLGDTDVICARCYDILTSCVQFIHRCLQAEAELEDRADFVEVDQNGQVIKMERDQLGTFEEITGSSSTITTNGDGAVTNDDHSYVYKPKPRPLDPLPEDVDDSNRVISVKRPNDKVLGSLIASLSTTGIRVFDCYSRSKRQLSTKRVLLLGTAIPPKLVQCEECGKQFRNQRIVLKHQQTHKRVRERKELMRKMALQRKEERERMRQEARLDAKLRIRCPTCHKDCKSKEELKEHIQTHPLLVCEVCGKGFPERYKLKIHMRTHNRTNSYVCHICGRCYGNMTLLKQHVSRHEEGRFLCNKCPKIFRHTLGLKNHLKRHDSNSSYACNECGKKCKAKSALRSHHRLVHLKNGNFKCDICGEGFVRGDYLKRHVKRHMKSEDELEKRPRNDAGPFMCKICDKVFPKLLGLKHHLFTHASLKPYRCKYCGLTFNRMPNKYRHEKRHERDPYAFNNKCPICWRLCQNEEELTEHISHHPTPYQCEVCEMSFARRYLLTHHVSENHTVPKEEAIYYESILQESLEVKYPRTEFLFENDAAET